MELIFMTKEDFIYVGIDLHKETHTAVIIDCYNNKLGEITFANRPADFPKLVTKVKKSNTDGKTVVYGLENAYGYGRPLAVWLIDKGYLVKDVNTAISHRQAKHRGAMYRKSDSDDAEAIALATLNMLDKLPDACPNDTYWSLGQLVHRRDNIMKQRTRLVNQLHEQLCIAYPSYKQFFNDISRPTALYFWEHYPSRKYLKGKCKCQYMNVQKVENKNVHFIRYSSFEFGSKSTFLSLSLYDGPFIDTTVE